MRIAATFNCPACSASLPFSNSSTAVCIHCGANIMVPGAAFPETPIAARPSYEPQPASSNALLTAQLIDLVETGQKIMAVKEFREKFGTSLKAALESVESLERGDRLVIGSAELDPNHPDVVRMLEQYRGSRTVSSHRRRTSGGPIFGVALLAALAIIVIGVVAAAVFIFLAA